MKINSIHTVILLTLCCLLSLHGNEVEVSTLISQAMVFDIDNVDSDINARLYRLNKDTVQLAALKTFMDAASSENAAVLHVRRHSPGDGHAKFADGSYVKLASWYEDAFAEGARLFTVLNVLSGDAPGNIMIMLKIQKGDIDRNYWPYVYPDQEMIVAVKPHVYSKAAPSLFYEFYGQSLFSLIPTKWPKVGHPPYFDGVFTREQIGQLTSLVFSKKIF